MIIADPKEKGYGFAKRIFDNVWRNDAREFGIDMAELRRTQFKDGEYKLKIDRNIRRKKCFYIHDPNKEPCKWFTDLNFVLEAMHSSSPSEINVVLPYMRFARQDRKDESRVSISAKAVSKMISLYADRGMTIDLHAPQIQGFFDIPFDDLRSHPVLANYLRDNYPSFLKNMAVVSPDIGGGKRLEIFQKRLAKDNETGLAIGYKERDKENHVNKITIMGNVKEKNCLVLDDIIDTGNTAVKTAEKLREEGARQIMLYGTHGLFTEGIERFGVFDRVLVSDTVYNQFQSRIEVVSMSDLFGEAIYRTIVGESLSSLFE